MATFWESPRGSLVNVDGVDEEKLAAMYAAEGTTGFDVAYYAADDSTRHAWRYGYRNPRVPGRIGEVPG